MIHFREIILLIQIQTIHDIFNDMENLLFNSDYVSFQHTMFKLLCLMAISGLLIYLLFLVFSKILYKKSRHRREITLRLTFLWTIFALLLVFDIYLFVLFFYTEGDFLRSGSWMFILGILPQVILLTAVIILFIIKIQQFKNIVNNNTLS
jgi:hypothetical protein